MSQDKILITGASGLIGSAVGRLLLEKGKHLLALDLVRDDAAFPPNANVTWLTGDVASAATLKQIAEHKLSALVHCAAHPGGKSLQEPAEDVRINAFGSMQLFEHCAKNQVRVLFLSSSIIYGEHGPSPIREADTLQPMTVYGACKVACENFLKILEQGYGLNWTVLRLFATYGPGHKPNPYQGIVNVILTQLLAGNHVILKGSPARVRDVIYISDTAEAIVTCLLSEATRGQIINVGTGQAVTVGEIAETLIQVMGRERKNIQLEEQAGTVGDPAYNVADISRLQSLTGFKPAYDLKRGLSEYLKKI